MNNEKNNRTTSSLFPLFLTAVGALLFVFVLRAVWPGVRAAPLFWLALGAALGAIAAAAFGARGESRSAIEQALDTSPLPLIFFGERELLANAEARAVIAGLSASRLAEFNAGAEFLIHPRTGRRYRLVSKTIPTGHPRSARVIALLDETSFIEVERDRRSQVALIGNLRSLVAALSWVNQNFATNGARKFSNAERELLAEADRAVGEIDRLIENLLLLSQIESGTVAAKREPVNPVLLVKELAAECASEFERRGARLKLVLPESIAALKVDRGLVKKALAELLHNAIRHNRPGGEIALEIAANDDEIEFKISDQGPGVPEHERERVFDKFYSGEAGGSAGPGLGLFIGNSIVTASGGRLWHTAPESGGSRFHAAFPTVKSEIE